jgi:hypothetical protein
MANKTKPTPAEIEEMRATVAAADAEAAEVKRLAKEAKFEPLKTALDTDAARAFYAKLDALRTAYDDDEYSENANIRAHLNATLTGLPGLFGVMGVQLTPPVDITPEATPETTPEA